MNKSHFIHLLIAVAIALFCLASCDDYNIVEPRFFSEKDITDVPICEEENGGGNEGGIVEAYYMSICWEDQSKKRLTISYSIARDTQVQICIYGRGLDIIKALVNAHQTAGRHSVYWDLRDNKGKKVDGGLYMVRICTDGYAESKYFEID